MIGLLIGGLAFVVSIVRDRFYQQDISDLEYMLELLEGGGGRLRIGAPRRRRGDIDDADDDLPDLTTGGARDGDGAAARGEPQAAPAAVQFAPVAVGQGSGAAAAGPDEPDEPTEIISWRPLVARDDAPGSDAPGGDPAAPGGSDPSAPSADPAEPGNDGPPEPAP